MSADARPDAVQIMACGLHMRRGMTALKRNPASVFVSVACKLVILVGLSAWPACDSETKAAPSHQLTSM